MDANGVDCDDIPGRSTDCDVEVTYMYTLDNIGGVSMDITELERTRGDSTVDLINEVNPKFLLVGESTKVTETEVVDFCLPNTFTTTVTAKADPPAGVPCESTDMYEFTTTPSCLVEVSIVDEKELNYASDNSQTNQLSLYNRCTGHGYMYGCQWR
jgi:hypothetical protein